MEILSAEIQILQLDGYLNALRCVIGHSSRKFGAGLIKKKGRNITEIIGECQKSIKYSEIPIQTKLVNFQNIKKILNTRIYSKLTNMSIDIVDNIDWNLIEYYGLVSTAEEENPSWNRLVSEDSYIIEYVQKGETIEDCSIIFFVEFDNFVIATYL